PARPDLGRGPCRRDRAARTPHGAGEAYVPAPGRRTAGHRVVSGRRGGCGAGPRGRGVLMGPTLAFFGSSLVSAYWNGAATYYRGIVRALHARGWQVTFFEPDAFGRQAHRDMPDPPWARVVVYQPTPDGLQRALDAATSADVLVKASGVGVCDAELEAALPAMRRPGQVCLFWDVDAPATLERLYRTPLDPLRAQLPSFDLVLTFGGGPSVVALYRALGARDCVPIYNALDPDTHHPVPPQDDYRADLS